MSQSTKTFEYQEGGLSYSVTIYEVDGAFFADILVNEGAMDVNAVYFGDYDFSGSSASLKGPLNMNGGGSQYEGETVQWDGAVKVSDPGLGTAGTDKESFVTAGETLTVGLPISSLDEIEFFGLRATSTTTAEGSIKAVSGDPETTDPEDPVDPEDPEDPEDPVEPEAATYEKVSFNYEQGGFNILAEAPEDNEFNVPVLPEGTEPTFANYLAFFEESGGDVMDVQSVVFYELDAEGNPQELFTLTPPEGGFADADALLEAYDAAIAEMAEGLDLMAALTIEGALEEGAFADADDDSAPLEVV